MSKEQNKNYGKSIRAKLLNVAKKEKYILSDDTDTIFSGTIVIQNVTNTLS